VVALGEQALDVLRRRQLAQDAHRWLVGDAWHRSDYVFTSAVGTPLDDSNVRRAFESMLKRARLPRIRFHDLRHTHATLMLAQGVHPKIVSERLGHATTGITLDTTRTFCPIFSTRRRGRWTTIWWRIVPLRTSLSRQVLPSGAAKWQQMLTSTNRKRPQEEPF